jgi:hypothetical protein
VAAPPDTAGTTDKAAPTGAAFRVHDRLAAPLGTATGTAPDGRYAEPAPISSDRDPPPCPTNPG